MFRLPWWTAWKCTDNIRSRPCYTVGGAHVGYRHSPAECRFRRLRATCLLELAPLPAPQHGLVCGKQSLRATAQALFMLGVLLGSLLFGQVSDMSVRAARYCWPLLIAVHKCRGQGMVKLEARSSTTTWVWGGLQEIARKCCNCTQILNCEKTLRHSFRAVSTSGLLMYLLFLHMCCADDIYTKLILVRSFMSKPRVCPALVWLMSWCTLWWKTYNFCILHLSSLQNSRDYHITALAGAC